MDLAFTLLNNYQPFIMQNTLNSKWKHKIGFFYGSNVYTPVYVEPYCWQADSSTQPETSHRSPNGDQKYVRRDWKKVKTKDGTASQ